MTASGQDLASGEVRDLLARLADEDFCDLHTRGRVTGASHTVELWFAVDADRVAFLAGGRDHADWIRNLRASPAAEVAIAGRRFAGHAAWVEGTDRELLVRRALAAKYQGWTEGASLSSWARTAVPVEIVLERLVAGR